MSDNLEADIVAVDWAIDALRKHLSNMDSHHAGTLYELSDVLREMAGRVARDEAA